MALICVRTSGVVIEEMLHLALAGNTLLAVGGTPILYDPKIIPAYPTPMLGRVPELTLHLRQMTKENLNTFIQVCVQIMLFYRHPLKLGLSTA